MNEIILEEFKDMWIHLRKLFYPQRVLKTKVWWLESVLIDDNDEYQVWGGDHFNQMILTTKPKPGLMQHLELR